MATLEAKIAFDTTAEAELGSLNMNGRRGTVSVVSSQAGTLKVYWSPGLSARIELASEATSVASSLNYKIIDLDQCLARLRWLLINGVVQGGFHLVSCYINDGIGATGRRNGRFSAASSASRGT